MKRMLRFGAIAVAIAMVLSAFPAFAAGQVSIYRYEDGSDFNLSYLAMYDSTLYLISYDNRYMTWKSEDGLSQVMEMDMSAMPEFEEGEGYVNTGGIFSGDDGLYIVLYEYSQQQSDEDETIENSFFEDAYLARIEPNAEGVLTMSEDMITLDWDDMIESYDDDYEYSREMRNPVVNAGKLIFSTYGDNGAVMAIYDLATGEGELTDVAAESFCLYKEGALVAIYDYESDETPVTLNYLDFETGEAEFIANIPVEGYQMPANLAYDANTDTLYFTMNGQLWRMPALDPNAVEAVCGLQAESWSAFPAFVTAQGDFICADYNTVSLCSTDPNDRPENTLTVYSGYNTYIDNAYYDFTAAHKDTEVVKLSTYSDIVQAMMNKSEDVDIYVVSADSTEYNSLFERGYMAELSASQTITDLVLSMYPAMQDAVVKDGVVYGLPVSMYSGGNMSYCLAAFEKLGLTEADVPATWMDFIKLLQRMPELIEGNDEVSVFNTYMTWDDLRRTLFYSIMDSYTLYMQSGKTEMSYDTALLNELLAEFEKIDFSGLGLPEEYEDDTLMASYNEDSILFETYADISCSVYSYQNAMKPLLLAMEEGAAPIVDCSIEVAFVNPFSQNKELAIKYLELAVAQMDKNFLTTACPDQNEPIPNQYYEENIKYYDDQLETMRAELEKADEADKEMWQQQIDEMQGYRDEYEKNNAYDATAESIEAYRQYAQYFYVRRQLGLDGDVQNEYYTQLEQYLAGNVDAATMLKEIDKKLKMMLMENM